MRRSSQIFPLLPFKGRNVPLPYRVGPMRVDRGPTAPGIPKVIHLGTNQAKYCFSHCMRTGIWHHSVLCCKSNAFSLFPWKLQTIPHTEQIGSFKTLSHTLAEFLPAMKNVPACCTLMYCSNALPNYTQAAIFWWWNSLYTFRSSHQIASCISVIARGWGHNVKGY